jgi:2,4-dienoyl-CoA reductase-like NADH-dependent reductase (Old Yellow Enzyme family)
MTTRAADADGYVTEEALAYYRARAEGGVGLVTVEMASPERAGKHRNFELGIYDDCFVPGLTRLADTIHAAGAKACIQLGHGGGHTRLDIAGVSPVAPSAIPHSVQEGHTEIIVPQEMSLARVSEAVEAFAAAAGRAARAGFDAVEIHAAHGYLISQFLAPFENRRTDRYGGSLENRARFGNEIVRAVKAAVPGLAVVFRMNGDDFFEGGLTPDEAVEVAVLAERAGADAIHVTGGHYRSQPNAAIMIPPMATAPTPFAAFARRIRGRVSVPVISVGRFGDPNEAARALADGTADFVALGRPLLADPLWVEKAASGDAVRLCIACNTCVDGMRAGQRLHCYVNPQTGRELAWAGRALRRRGERIAVIGAGPAGLSYAAEAALANQVSVFERDAVVGGAFRLAGCAPRFQGVEAASDTLFGFVEGLAARCRELGATIELGTDPLRQPGRLDGFDHVVIATGATYPAGMGRLVAMALRKGAARRAPLRHLTEREHLRDWFYYRARSATGHAVGARLPAGMSAEIIGDALTPGKGDAAILSAFEAAYEAVPREPHASVGMEHAA